MVSKQYRKDRDVVVRKTILQDIKVPYDLYEKQSVVAQALAHPVRIAILNVLRKGPHCVQDITHHVCAKQSNISRHLAFMVSAGILTSEKRGLRVVYSIRTRCVLRFLDCLSDCLKEQIHSDQKLAKII